MNSTDVFCTILNCSRRKHMFFLLSSSSLLPNQLSAYRHLLHWIVHICKCAWAQNKVTSVKADQRGERKGMVRKQEVHSLQISTTNNMEDMIWRFRLFRFRFRLFNYTWTCQFKCNSCLKSCWKGTVIGSKGHIIQLFDLRPTKTRSHHSETVN